MRVILLSTIITLLGACKGEKAESRDGTAYSFSSELKWDALPVPPVQEELWPTFGVGSEAGRLRARGLKASSSTCGDSAIRVAAKSDTVFISVNHGVERCGHLQNKTPYHISIPLSGGQYVVRFVEDGVKKKVLWETQVDIPPLTESWTPATGLP